MLAPGTSSEAFVFDAPTRILVVDDDPLLGESARVYLSNAGAQVEIAPHGQAALDLLSAKKFDIALVDIEMPRMGGFDLVERLRAQETLRHLPVIMLTVRGDPDSIDRAYAAGATAYLQKPINWRQLAHQVQQLVRSDRKPPAPRRPAAPAGKGAARDSLLARSSARQDEDKSLQVMVGVLILVASIMTLLWASPASRRAAAVDCKPPHCSVPH